MQSKRLRLYRINMKYIRDLANVDDNVLSTSPHQGLLQEDVASALNMTRVAVGYIEQGRRAPRLKTLYDLAQLYEVDIRHFFAFLE